jgi:hypothetical protein
MHHIKEHARKVHHARHAHHGMTSTTSHPGYASGGAKHPHKGHSASDEKADTALIHSLVKPDALNRARGGRTSHGKKSGGTHVNILVGHPGEGTGGPGPIPPAAMAAMGPGGPGAMPPQAMARPPMPPMGGAGGPPPGIGGAPVMPPRKHGGRTRHK